MSYHSWSVDGYGLDVSKIINNLTCEKWSLLKAELRHFWEETTPYSDEDYPEAKAFFDAPVDADFKKEIDKARETFDEYESAKYCICGFDPLVADMFTWLWKNNGHDEVLITIVSDDFYDSHVYWLISPVYVWTSVEKFSSQDACRDAIVKSMKGFVTEDAIDFEEIEQGG